MGVSFSPELGKMHVLKVTVSHSALSSLIMFGVFFIIIPSKATPPFGPVFMYDDEATFKAITDCLEAQKKFDKVLTNVHVQLLAFTDLAYLNKKCKFSFDYKCLDINVSRVIEISAVNILELTTLQTLETITH